MSDVAIVPAKDEHGDALIALIEPIFAEYEGVLFVLDEMPELRAIATSFEAAGGAFWCAFAAELLVGSVGFTPALEGNGVELKKLYVARSQRRHGLGGRLLDTVEAAARRRRADFVELWSDVKFETAHRFYQRRGYRKTGETRALGDASKTVEYHFHKKVG